MTFEIEIHPYGSNECSRIIGLEYTAQEAFYAAHRIHQKYWSTCDISVNGLVFDPPLSLRQFKQNHSLSID